MCFEKVDHCQYLCEFIQSTVLESQQLQLEFIVDDIVIMSGTQNSMLDIIENQLQR